MRQNLQEMLYRYQINQAVVFLQEHWSEPISLDQLADLAGFSRFHFHRIFATMLGETVGDYVRRLRLGKAFHSLATTSYSITHIALDHGYETPAAFSYAFRKQFGITPSECRQGKLPKNISPMKKQSHNLKRRTEMKAEIRELPDQHIVYVEKSGLINRNFNHAASQAFDQLCNFLNKQHLWNSVGACLGICPDDPDSTPPQEARYLGGFVIKEGTNIYPSGEVKTMVIRGGRFAVITHKGPYETLWQTWTAAYRDWLPVSGEKLRNVAPYEVYVNSKEKVKPENLITEIFIAVE